MLRECVSSVSLLFCDDDSVFWPSLKKTNYLLTFLNSTRSKRYFNISKKRRCDEIHQADNDEMDRPCIKGILHEGKNAKGNAAEKTDGRTVSRNH